MLTRRGFLGALAAIAAAPRKLFARAGSATPTWTVTANDLKTYTYKYKFVKVQAFGETGFVPTLTDVTHRTLHVNGGRVADIPHGATSATDDEHGITFHYPQDYDVADFSVTDMADVADFSQRVSVPFTITED